MLSEESVGVLTFKIDHPTELDSFERQHEIKFSLDVGGMIINL